MEGDYSFVSFLDGFDSIIKLNHYRHGVQIWYKMKVRKDTTCDMTGEAIKKGDMAYKPLGNTMNRMNRLSVEAVKKLNS